MTTVNETKARSKLHEKKNSDEGVSQGVVFSFSPRTVKNPYFAKNKIKCGLVNFKSVLSFDTE